MTYALIAWIVSAICVGVAVRKSRRIGAVELPSVGALVTRIEREVRPKDSAFLARARAELDELSHEVDRETGLHGELARSLVRIALGAGTALALLAYLGAADRSDLRAPGLSFLGGIFGAVLTAQIGRLASARARHARAHWSDTVARAWTRLSGESAHGE